MFFEATSYSFLSMDLESYLKYPSSITLELFKVCLLNSLRVLLLSPFKFAFENYVNRCSDDVTDWNPDYYSSSLNNNILRNSSFKSESLNYLQCISLD